MIAVTNYVIQSLQRDCLRFAMTAKPAERFMPENPNTLQYKVWRLVDSIPFEYLIMLLIAGNTMILMLKVSDTQINNRQDCMYIQNRYTYEI